MAKFYLSLAKPSTFVIKFKNMNVNVCTLQYLKQIAGILHKDENPEVHTSHTNRQISYVLLTYITVSYKHEIHSRDDKRPYPASLESSLDSHTILLTKYLTSQLTN